MDSSWTCFWVAIPEGNPEADLVARLPWSDSNNCLAADANTGVPKAQECEHDSTMPAANDS